MKTVSTCICKDLDAIEVSESDRWASRLGHSPRTTKSRSCSSKPLWDREKLTTAKHYLLLSHCTRRQAKKLTENKNEGSTGLSTELEKINRKFVLNGMSFPPMEMNFETSPLWSKSLFMDHTNGTSLKVLAEASHVKLGAICLGKVRCLIHPGLEQCVTKGSV